MHSDGFHVLRGELMRKVRHTSGLITNIFNFHVVRGDSQGNCPGKEAEC